jgi:hypothetical protein
LAPLDKSHTARTIAETLARKVKTAIAATSPFSPALKDDRIYNGRVDEPGR